MEWKNTTTICLFKYFTTLFMFHGLRTPREEIAFTARPKIHSHSQIFRYGWRIFCLPHRPNLSDIFDLCLQWVSVVRGAMYRRKISSIIDFSRNNDLPIRPSATSRLFFVKCTQHLPLVSLQIVFVLCRKTYQVTQHNGAWKVMRWNLNCRNHNGA